MFPCYFLVFVIALLATADARYLRTTKRMVNAEVGSITEFPYLVFIGNENYVCNGVIIARYYVLTAAHCVLKDPSELIIRAGSDFKDEGGSIHHITLIKSHEDFYISRGEIVSSDDIAVVKVREPFLYDATTRPIELYGSRDTVKIGEVAEISGYGQSENQTWPRQLRKLNISITDPVGCNRTYSDEGYMKPGQICARSKVERSYACYGDSGGPLVVRNRLAGIGIYGGPCEIDPSDEVYTEVAYYRDWIDRNVQYDRKRPDRANNNQLDPNPDTNNIVASPSTL